MTLVNGIIFYLNLRSPSTSCGNTWNQPSPWPNVENFPPTDLSSPGGNWCYDTPILPTRKHGHGSKKSPPFPKKHVFSKLQDMLVCWQTVHSFVQTDLVFPILQLHPPQTCFHYVQHMLPHVQHVSPYSSILSNRSLHIVKFLKCCFHILWLVFFEFNSSPAQLHSAFRAWLSPLCTPLAWDILVGCWVMIIQAICQFITPLAGAWRSKAVRFVPTYLTHPETQEFVTWSSRHLCVYGKSPILQLPSRKKLTAIFCPWKSIWPNYDISPT